MEKEQIGISPIGIFTIAGLGAMIIRGIMRLIIMVRAIQFIITWMETVFTRIMSR